MLDQRLLDVLQGKESNYLFPFFWQRGNHTEHIPEQIQRIYDSGCREFCIESKSHPDFCGDGWWRDVDIILREAQKLGMRIWILDDDKFPTGHANGMIEKKYPHLKQWNLVERHIDVAGPVQDISVFAKDAFGPEDILLGAYAYKRVQDVNETCTYEAIDVTDCVKGDYLYWNVPEGVWRIFFYYKSRRGGWNNYIDMISSESVQVLIEAVYEAHWKRYKEHFGKTILGFFSDEPAFVNQYYGIQRVHYGFYEQRIGTPGLALPWNENVRDMMQEKLGYDPMPHLNLLWYSDDSNGDDQAELRFAYMDAVTRLYSECFTKQLSDWCHAHGVLYTGHVIEDMGSHCHLHHSPGHYFRATQWQDMSGIDVVFQQVLPGMEHLYHTSSAQGVADGDFFHYVLGKLGASFAHLNPLMKGRAMCEMFGAYGWGADTTLMRYIIDFMLVRGINRFVPHAFGTRFPDPEFPPHFSAEGKNPSYEGFSALMRYINRAAHLLDGAIHVANAAVLYNAEGEWTSRFREAMPMQPIVTRLYDAHIDYDIVPMDMLRTALVRDNKLCIEKENFDCLIIPYADHLPIELQEVLRKLDIMGLPVWFFGGRPENAIFKGNVIEPEELISTMRQLHMTDVVVEEGNEKLRIYHCYRGEHHIYMFFNEDLHKTVDTVIQLPTVGEYARMDLLGERYCSGETKDGAFSLQLLPNQSQIVIFGGRAGLEEERELPCGTPIQPEFYLELAKHDDMLNFVTLGTYQEFFNVTGPDCLPQFSGKMKYTFMIDIPVGTGKAFLDLGRVGQNAVLKINGKSLGIRVAPPYLFEITGAIKEGENQVEVIVSNTLVQEVKDHLSYLLPLAPSGLLGGMKLMCIEQEVDFSTLSYIAFGDSITFGADYSRGYAQMDHPYPQLVADRLNLSSVINRGVCGATLCTNNMDLVCMTDIITAYTEKADIISVLLGVNDYNRSLPLGNMGDSTNTTVYGSLKLIARHLTTTQQDAFVFFMTPYKTTWNENTTYKLLDVVNAIKEVASMYEIPVLDLYHVGNFEMEMSNSDNDGLHPLQGFIKQYAAPQISDFIRDNYHVKRNGAKKMRNLR